MKMRTAWWGCQILAETEKDKKILTQLVDSLPKENIKLYEGGGISVVNKDDYDNDPWSFDHDEICASKMVVEINR